MKGQTYRLWTRARRAAIVDSHRFQVASRQIYADVAFLSDLRRCRVRQDLR